MHLHIGACGMYGKRDYRDTDSICKMVMHLGMNDEISFLLLDFTCLSQAKKHGGSFGTRRIARRPFRLLGPGRDSTVARDGGGKTQEVIDQVLR